jgi:hypothetical protein
VRNTPAAGLDRTSLSGVLAVHIAELRRRGADDDVLRPIEDQLRVLDALRTLGGRRRDLRGRPDAPAGA